VSAMMRKAAVLIGVPVLLVLVIASAYYTAHNFQRIRENENLRQRSSLLQAEISAVQLSLADVEAGQRGYLLTGDSSYLDRYTQAAQQLPLLFSRLRSELSEKPQDERSLESKVESLTQSKLAEAEETIRLRQQGYRHRAFGIVDSNRGKQLMDEARVDLSTLSSAEARRLTGFEQRTSNDISWALTETVGSTLVLLVSTGLVFGMLRTYSKGLELKVARGDQVLRDKTAQLESMALTVSQQLPDLLREVQDSMGHFLNHFRDYLPVSGQTQAAQIKEMAERSNRLVADSLSRSVSNAA
jgi:methyl-accepting chemotaxis protein